MLPAQKLCHALLIGGAAPHALASRCLCQVLGQLSQGVHSRSSHLPDPLWWPPLRGNAPSTSFSNSSTRTFFGSAPSTPSNKKYSERRLVGYSQEQLYEVVADVEQYQQFVPWCVRSRVLMERQDKTYLEAELEVGFQMLVERYVSKVKLQRPSCVTSSSSQTGLFDHLESSWYMRPGPLPNTTWLTFSIDFAFSSALYRHVAELFFSEVVQRMMAAFEGRCATLYGPSSLVQPPAAKANAAAHQQRQQHVQQLQQQQRHQVLPQQQQQQQQQALSKATAAEEEAAAADTSLADQQPLQQRRLGRVPVSHPRLEGGYNH